MLRYIAVQAVARPSSKLMLNLLTEFEHELIAERTRAGLARGRREGRIGGRHPVVIDRTRAEELAAET